MLDGIQSSLHAAGSGASYIATLFWWMAAGSVVVWLAVIGLAAYCARVEPSGRIERRNRLLIIGAGTVVPIIILTVLLIYGLALLPPLVAPAPPGSLRIAVAGELWWWRIRYLPADGAPVELANEIRLPVNRPVQFMLSSDNVIHAFWIPSLGGKLDMIPGRVTQLTLHPTQTGIFRGTCAEYCGSSHAWMSFYVEVMEPAAFDRWLANQAAPARPPTTPLQTRGRDLFVRTGCGACHAVRGAGPDATIGPDLTHVGTRMSLAAGMLPARTDTFRRWIALTEHLKPSARMPAFEMLPADDLDALAAYLEGLE